MNYFISGLHARLPRPTRRILRAMSTC